MWGDIAQIAPLVLIAIAVLVWLLLLHLSYSRARLSAEAHYAETHQLTTGDGATVELRRLAAPSQRAPTGEQVPVLLVHGICANHRNVDPHPNRSLARHLSRRGRDVWLLTLRTACAQPRRLRRTQMRFKSLAHEDLPTGVHAVLEQTGSDQIDFVGFSMGGMLLYAAIGKTVPERVIRRAVAIGAPLRMPALGPLCLARHLSHGLTPTMKTGLLSRIFAFAVRIIPRPLRAIVYNPANAEIPAAQQSMVDLVEDLPGALSADFVRWSHHGQIQVDGEPLLDRIASASVPIHIFAGAVDHIAPPQEVRAAFEAWGSRREAVEKQFTLLSKSDGTVHDYGHGDMCMGSHVHHDIFVPVEQFLHSDPDAHANRPAA